jgi:hypothetical protein
MNKAIIGLELVYIGPKCKLEYGKTYWTLNNLNSDNWNNQRLLITIYSKECYTWNEVNENFLDYYPLRYFLTLDKWRENQINEIINDD